MISDHRFREALASANDDSLFAHMPVDWWDAAAGVWRPAVIETGWCEATTQRTHTSIMVPIDHADPASVECMTRAVAIADLRPSRLLTDGIATFFATHYTLDLVDALVPCFNFDSDDERVYVEGLMGDLLDVYADSYASWCRRFARGSDGSTRLAPVWRSRAVDATALPRRQLQAPGVTDLFSAVDRQLTTGTGNLDCAPVVVWDEAQRLWRPTLILGATTSSQQFMPASRVSILRPGDPIDVITVSGADVQPLDLMQTCLSLIAIPVIARDYLRMYDALRACGFDAGDIATHPTVIAFAEMLNGAASDWKQAYDDGFAGTSPPTRVKPIDVSLWGVHRSTASVA